MRPDALQADLAAAAASRSPIKQHESAGKSSSSIAGLSVAMMAPKLLREKAANTKQLFEQMNNSKDPAMSNPKAWTFAAWLDNVGTSGVLADALLERTLDPSRSTSTSTSAGANQKGGDDDELSKVLSLVAENTKLHDVVKARILNSIDELTEFVSRRLISLAGRASEPPPQPIEKFTLNEALVGMPGDSLEAYYIGLEARLGPPDRAVYETVESEHTEREDSKFTFSSASYEIMTTSRDEWKFVARPEEAGKYAREKATMPEGVKPRKPLKLDELRSRMRQFNLRLKEGELPVSEIEAICARLYTGPMGVKYASVVRGYGQVIAECRGNTYTTTIHALNSFIVKASKMTQASLVYRGVYAGTLPEWFWNAQAGVYGCVEAGLMSASLSKHFALDVGGQGQSSVMFEICQGMTPAARGADVTWVAQWPQEQEIVFSPFTGLEVLHTRVDEATFVIVAKPSVNLQPATIEQIIYRRQALVSELCERLVSRVTRLIDDSDEWAYVRAMHPNGGALKLVRNAMQRMMREIWDRSPEYFYDDAALAASMSEAVDKANQVSRWASELPSLQRYLPFSMPVRDLNHLLKLTSLGLAHKSLGRHDVVGLCGLLVINTSISVISLLYNNFTTEEAARFAQIARARKEYPLSLCGIGEHQTEAKLVTDVRLKAADAVLLSADLQTRPALTKLDLDENAFGVEGGVAICEALLNPPASGLNERQGLKSLSMTNCGLEAEGGLAVGRVLGAKHCILTELSIGFNRIGVAGARAISEALMVNTTLVSLNLHYNSIGDVGASKIFEAVESNNRTKLASLVLSSNEITGVGAMSIAGRLEADAVPKLTSMDLSYNQLGMQGGMAIVEALRVNTALCMELTLRSCAFDISVLQALRDVEQQHRGLEIIAGLV
jgi:hypothetical protein